MKQEQEPIDFLKVLQRKGVEDDYYTDSNSDVILDPSVFLKDKTYQVMYAKLPATIKITGDIMKFELLASCDLINHVDLVLPNSDHLPISRLISLIGVISNGVFDMINCKDIDTHINCKDIDTQINTSCALLGSKGSKWFRTLSIVASRSKLGRW